MNNTLGPIQFLISLRNFSKNKQQFNSHALFWATSSSTFFLYFTILLFPFSISSQRVTTNTATNFSSCCCLCFHLLWQNSFLPFVHHFDLRLSVIFPEASVNHGYDCKTFCVVFIIFFFASRFLCFFKEKKKGKQKKKHLGKMIQ